MSELIAPRIDSRKAKLAGRAAEQIVSDVIELGWPVGHVLGSEAELLERYGVSRAVLREAVRLVEHQRVARMRRGTGGGLVIDEPDIEAVIGPAIIYLLRVDATLDEIFDTRILLEELAAEIASQRAGESDIPCSGQPWSARPPAGRRPPPAALAGRGPDPQPGPRTLRRDLQPGEQLLLRRRGGRTARGRPRSPPSPRRHRQGGAVQQPRPGARAHASAPAR